MFVLPFALLAFAFSKIAVSTTPMAGAMEATVHDDGLLDYGQLPSFDQVELSPDGTRLAYIGALGDVRHVLVKDLSSGRKLVDFVEAPRQKIRALQWADNDHLLTLISMTTSVSLWGGEWGEYFGVIAADVGTGQAWDVVERPGGVPGNTGRVNWVSGRVRTRWLDGQPWIYLSGYFLSGGQWEAQGRMMRVNLRTRSHVLIESRLLQRADDGLLDEHGDVVATINYDQDRGHWQIDVGNREHSRRALAGDSFIDIPSLQGISPDGQNIWLTTWSDGAASSASIPVVENNKSTDAGSGTDNRRTGWHHVLLDPRNDRVIAGVTEGNAEPTYEFLDPKIDKHWQAARNALGNVAVRLISMSDDVRRVVVLTDSATGPQYQLIDMTSSQVVPLGSQRRHIPAVAEVRTIEYPAADGLTIAAYLTMPANRSTAKLPLVVLPHGGPEARDYGGFDWWAQALAYEGYAVLQPNFRGSTTSDASVVAGRGQWGRKMQTDLSDGVHYLAEKGVVDPARVCIVGASYGGYAALAGVSLQHDIYRCAVAVAGVSDLHELMKPYAQILGNRNWRNRYFERWLGVTDLDDPSVDERSPVKHADAIRVPILLIHGSDDTVVPFDQSRRMADALTRLHRPFQMEKLKSEDHWLSHGQTRLQMLQATVAFLKANNPPDAPPGVGVAGTSANDTRPR